MKVRLEKTFPVAGPASAAWEFLQELEGVAECLPGARITERTDDAHYKGQVKLKVGPVTATFAGDIEVLHVDSENRELRFVGKGRDTRGTTMASMDLTARVQEAGEHASELVGISEISVTGKLATLGGRLMNQVADHVLKQFAEQFSSRVAALGEGAVAPSAGDDAAPPAQHLDGVALLWSVVVGFFKNLLGAKGSAGRE